MIRKIYYYLKIYDYRRLSYYIYWELRMRIRWILRKSFSQDGEDIVINRLVINRKRGFYVDIGAYDPTRFSNTKRFYLKGWRGINIEPDPSRIKKFYKLRPQDINLNIGIASKTEVLSFFEFSPTTLSTFSKKVATGYQKRGFKLIKISKIKVQKLSNVLRKYCRDKPIDFFSIDTEGFDFEVLKSNNWKKFRPKVICIESSQKNVDKLLSNLGYKKVYKTRPNSIFVENFQLKMDNLIE